jgi:hypothetical protein
MIFTQPTNNILCPISDRDLAILNRVCARLGSGNEQRVVQKAIDTPDDLDKDDIDTLKRLDVEFDREIRGTLKFTRK